MKKQVSVIYHGDCPDGKFAAYAAWRKFVKEGSVPPDAIEFIPMLHGQGLPSDLADTIYILDFCFSRDILTGLAASHAHVTVIDHHQTAQAACEGLPFCIFDMEHSGAALAWMHFFPGTEVPAIIQYVEDRDIWKWALPESLAINNVLLTYVNKPFRDIHELVLKHQETGGMQLVREGQAIQNHVEYQLERCLQHVQRMRIGTHDNIPTVNLPLYQSDMGHYLCKQFPDAPFCALYWDRNDGLRQFSLRSVGDFDVSRVAQTFGGGGHKNAAGFQIVSRYSKGRDITD